ncbi:putative bifunctional diguanylate cyclase/phosphodiesterase [Aquipuribacter nitratireducens]|uniref:Bifunctional diguanylate cyclase/phosphodiesterase n=1 Tax=Aquipuribacter nitratireducens TaxID=650104 RepID=A0ABW0GMA4_9MICO
MTREDHLDPGVRQALLHAAEVAGDAVLVVRAGAPSTVAWVNPRAEEVLGAANDTVAGAPLGRVLDTPADLLTTTRGTSGRGSLRGADGTRTAVDVTSHPVPGGALWVLTAVPAQRRRPEAEAEAVQAVERRFTALAERTPVPTVLSDVGLRLAHVNDAFTRLVGLPAEAVLGTAWLDLVHREDLDVVTGCARTALEGTAAETFARLLTADGAERWVHLRLAPTTTPRHGSGFVGTAEDVTERRAFERQLAYQARHDPLTGLPNRAALFEHLQRALLGARGASPDLAVLFLDLDNFKLVNDSLGHHAGDALLVDVGRRLRAAVRDQDVVTRMGGDEFVVVCHGVGDDEEAAHLAARVLEVCTQPTLIGSLQVHPSASMGVARVDQGTTSAQDVLRDADIAMYRAKALGKNRFALCDAATRDTARDELRLLADLRAALEGTSPELHVVYQPVVALAGPGDDSRDGVAAGPLPVVEALARWTHPRRGTVPPDVFVPLAENHQLVGRLGETVLDAACAQLVEWRAALGSLAPQRVAVNVSPHQLGDPGFVDMVTGTLARHGLEAAALCLEVTESALVADPATTRQVLHALRSAGVAVAIDDFGVGYSSLAHLRRLPVDHLKIDRSFVTELAGPQADTDGSGALAGAVVSLARALGLSTVAEGVEHPEQARALQELGCTYAQGWLWARGMAGADLTDWVRGRAGGGAATADTRSLS